MKPKYENISMLGLQGRANSLSGVMAILCSFALPCTVFLTQFKYTYNYTE